MGNKNDQPHTDTMVTIEPIDDLDGIPYANAFPTEEPKTLRLTLSAGERAETHDHPDRYVVLYLISGDLSLQLDDESYQLESGDIVHFDGAHTIISSATTDSTALFVLSKKIK